MKQLQLTTAFLLITIIATSQKPVLDVAALNNRKSVRGILGAGISLDGNYLYYTLYESEVKNIIVRSAKGDWQRVLKGISEKGFSTDNTKFIYQDVDSLCFLDLRTDKVEAVKKIKTIGFSRNLANIDWLAWQYKNDSAQVLVLRQLSTGHEQRFTGVIEYGFSDSQISLFLKIADNVHQRSLSLVHLASGEKQTIWQSTGDAEVGAYNFDSKANQLTFMVKSIGGNRLMYYHSGMKNAEMKIDDHSDGIDSGWRVSGARPKFTESGRCIIFELEQKEEIKKEPQAAAVDLWSYRDAIPTMQPKTITCKAAINLSGGRVTSLQCGRSESVNVVGDIAIFRKAQNPLFNWVGRNKDNYYWKSLVDGNEGALCSGDIGPTIFGSPDGRWLFYFDNSRKGFNSYEFLTGKTRFISGYKLDVGYGGLKGSKSVCGWLTDGRMLAFDRYDIWAIDPMGNSTENLTRSFGRSHRIQFRRLEDTDLDQLVSPGSALRMNAFDEKTKYNGFYQLTFGKAGSLQQLSLSPCYLTIIPAWKALMNTWIVLKESVEEAPNYFITHDLKRFEPITDIQPPQKYNLMKAKLIHYRQTDGKLTDAVLYKPENFDPLKKYPVIFHYYETMTEKMYCFKGPSPTGGDINIPWFVSHGYLVCTPDIQYTFGHTGESALASVEGAARFLSRLPYVDNTRMGLQGHSFGGYETNFIITHSQRFKAACSASGPSDLFSWYGSQWGNGAAQDWSENGQLYMGGTPWALKKRYLESSPIISTDKVTTPLLMMANKKDEVMFQQGIEFFLGLRRLDKKVWLLQYDNGGHSVGGRDAVDFTIRLTQFFDHYLKGERAPKWMTEGLPARYKGKLSKFELDGAGVKTE
ncbi:MAG: prolyl oligopeptidase family serine peptidase [Bacteroidota bacterium]